MKDFIKNIFTGMVSSYIITFLSLFVSFIIGYINPVLIPYIVIGVTIIIILLLTKYYLFTGLTWFKWTHIYAHDTLCMTLKNNKEAITTEKLSTVKRKGFQGKVTGDHYWDDVCVKKIEMKSKNANIKLSYKDKNGILVNESNKNCISIKNKTEEAHSEIEFNNNKIENIIMETTMDYSRNKMKPEFYCDVVRPIRVLTVELKVSDELNIRNIRKEITTQYGEGNPETVVHTKPINRKTKKSEPSISSYKFTIINPKIYYKYKIAWDWI